MAPPTDDELEAVQTALDNDGAQIITVGNRLGQEAMQLVLATAKPIKKLQDRLIRDANKHLVATDNAINFVQTSLLNGVNTWLQEAGFLLQNLAVKGGIIEPGDPLEKALAQEVADEPQIEYLGTLVLAVKEAVPWLDRIAVACERIAAALEGTPAPSQTQVNVDAPAGGAGADTVDDGDLGEAVVEYWEED
jgi:hypothetical protein